MSACDVCGRARNPLVRLDSTAIDGCAANHDVTTGVPGQFADQADCLRLGYERSQRALASARERERQLRRLLAALVDPRQRGNGPADDARAWLAANKEEG